MLSIEQIKTTKRKEVLGFIIAGSCAVSFDFASYTLLMYIGIDRNIAKASSYIIGATIGFFISKFFAFESWQFSTSEIYRYIFLYICSAVTNAIVNNIVISTTSLTLLSFLFATGISTILNFLGQKFFVFKKY